MKSKREGFCRNKTHSGQSLATTENLSLLTSIILIPVFLCSGVFLGMFTSPSVSATSLTLSIADTVSLDIVGGASSTGVFASSSTSDTTISIKTDNYTGYTLGIAASNSSITALTSDGGNTIPSITSAIDESTFSTSTSYNNKWGYKPSKFNSSVNTNYLPAPSATTSSPDTLDQTNSPNPTAANTYNIAIGARVNNTTAPGTYTNSYIITVVANGTPYTLTYNANAGSDAVSGMPNNVTASDNAVSYADTINLGTTTPTRTGYTFAGWCASNASQTQCGSSGTDTLYNQTNNNLANFPIDRTASSNDVNVYAIWTPVTYTIKYYANSGSGSIANQTVNHGSSIALADNAFTRTNYYFKGWATSSGGAVAYRPSQSITPTGNMNLYAVWGNSTTTSLYDVVASLTRGNQTNNTNATTGIKTHPTKATSGVYTYNASVFGTSSDSVNTSAIYYYRGILDTNLDGTSSTYGSNGNSMNYPNYVKLGDTCWRIVRTTGSGGVKMIYNGSYSGGTTANSCANAQTNAQVATSAFNATSNVGNKSIIAVGYTFNSNYKTTTADTTVGELFGTESSYANNDTRSTIKTYIEDTWYASNMTSWTSILEANAGYCNDRSIYNNNSYAASAVLSDSTSISTPYTTATSGITTYSFGAYTRNSNSAQAPSLACPYATRDLYRYVSGSTGTSNQLKYPVALLTADEMSFAGSGATTASYGSGYHYNSYLRSGSYFWLLSPYYRRSNGYTNEYSMTSTSSPGNNDGVSPTYGVRPAISLKSGTTIESGSGTATSPWVIPEPKTMQTATSADCGQELVDSRDGNTYTTAKIGSLCWMTKNLDLPGGTTLTSSNSNVSSSYTLPASSTSGFSDSSTAYVYNSGSTTCSSSSACYSYYSYAAATAGTNPSSGASSYDICPKGWRLPIKEELTTLMNTYNTGATLTASPFLGVYASQYSNSSFSDGGSRGYYWSSTVVNSYDAYYLHYRINTTATVTRSSKYSGRSIRCVAKS